MRVDPFTTIHKGIRSLLFDAAVEAALVDIASDFAVDALAERIERMFGFLEEHAEAEDAEILPLVRGVAPGVAARLVTEHLELEAAASEVGRAVTGLVLTAAPDRRPRAKELLRLLNVLTAKHLLHMNHEETMANAVLWGSFGDPELMELGRRIYGRVTAERRSAWQALLAPVLDPDERALVIQEPAR